MVIKCVWLGRTLQTLFSRGAGFALVMALVAVVTPKHLYADTLYAVTFGANNSLITINPANGAGTLIGNLSTLMNPMGLGDRNGNLYTFDQTADVVRQLNPATGATVATINVNAPNLTGEGSFDFAPSGLAFLTVSGFTSTLYRVDIDAGTTTLVGTLGANIDGLAFNSAGVLYGIGQQTGTLFTVNPATAALTTIGNTGVTGETLAGLAFDSSNNLYAAFNNGTLYSINPTTGAGTLIGATGFNGISGLTFVPDVGVIPEPTSLVLLGSGLAGLILVSRRRRSQQPPNA